MEMRDVTSSSSFWIRSSYDFSSPRSETLSNLPLQISLYFNIFYSPLLILLLSAAYLNKFPLLPGYYQFVSIIVLLLVFGLEVSRLYLGYRGNLGELVPHLTGCCILSALQIICCLYLILNLDMLILPIEICVIVPELLFLISQCFCGVWAIQRMVRSQKKKTILELISKRD
ncbi:Transmembrane protein 17-like [Oopsacas minuta]|uniref:Transmembrane protein 17-like n=1 Tax=Oopsacas minuta TaxID=111878 RepID=A0AAV7K408_9METZ|nr:Transmembrane protein 17-like [Oopsacas minuta]